MAETLIISAACGVVVGMLSGLLGIGGGVVVIPLMRMGFGVEGLIATGTSLFVILPTSLTGVIGRVRNHSLNVKVGLLVGVGGVLFSPIGSWLATVAGGPASMIAAAIVIACTGINMFRKALKLKKPAVAAGKPASAAVESSGAPGQSVPATGENGSAKTEAVVESMQDPQFADAMAFALTPVNVIKALGVGVVAGMLSGFIGVGGGFIIIPLLMWMFNFSFKDASGISLLALCLLAVPGIITHGMLGHIDFVRGLMLIAGSIPGAIIGTALLKRIHEKSLRLVFGVLLAAVGVSLGIGEFM